MGTKLDSKSNTSGQFYHKIQFSCPLLFNPFPTTPSEEELPLLTAWHPTTLGCETLLQVFCLPEERMGVKYTKDCRASTEVLYLHTINQDLDHLMQPSATQKWKKEPIELKIRQSNETEYAQAMSSNYPNCRNKAESQCSTLPSANSVPLQSALLECYRLCASTISSP